MERKSTAYVLAAGALWGCICLFVRPLSDAGIGALDIAAIRMGVGAIGVLAIILAKNRSLLRIRLRDIWLFVGTGVVSLTLFNLCYITCFNMSENSIAVVLLYTSPIWIMLMSALFFHERITRRKLAALGLTFAGCVLVAGLLGGTVQLTPMVLLTGVASGLFYGSYSIFGRVALRRYDPLTLTFYTFVFGTAASLLLGDPAHTIGCFAADPPLIAAGLGIGVVCTLAPFLLYTMGLKGLDTGKAGILATSEPLVGSLAGFIVFGDSLGVQKIVGIVLILAAVVLVNTKGRGEAQAVQEEA